MSTKRCCHGQGVRNGACNYRGFDLFDLGCLRHILGGQVMSDKVMVGRKVLIPHQNVLPEVADMVFALVQARYPGAKRVPAR